MKGGLENEGGKTETTICPQTMWEAMKARMDATGGRWLNEENVRAAEENTGTNGTKRMTKEMTKTKEHEMDALPERRWLNEEDVKRSEGERSLAEEPLKQGAT
jgi:hypothetical protein